RRARGLLDNIQLFVLCHGLLQLSQLLYSAYFKSIITTIERRYGLSSYSAGSLSSLNEISNSALIVFVSYFGDQVHRPRLIGVGGLLMAVSATVLTLPHFLSQPYEYDSVLHNQRDLCNMHTNQSEPTCGREESRQMDENQNLWLLMASAQLLFGVGSVPIQPFGLSYIDDFAGPGNSALYIAILFSVSVFGPAVGYLLGSVVLQFYVDLDKAALGAQQELHQGDPRWVGAWWMGLLITTGFLILTSVPYFFFPRSMPSKHGVRQTQAVRRKSDTRRPERSVQAHLKRFPRMLLHLLLNPLFLLLVLAQCCFSSVIAGLSTFLNKFLEQQFGASAAYSSLLVGALNLPAVAVGMLLGGVIMKRVGLTLKTIPRFSVVMLTTSLLLCVPLFFMGCHTHEVMEVNHLQGSLCSTNCSCLKSAFNPVCGSDAAEYISPCHAGCTNFTKDPNNSHRVQLYTQCTCVGGSQSQARPGPCPNSCPQFLIPAILVISLAALIASITHNPLYMMVLRSVASEEKSFAIGIQFLLMRVLAWLPAPALFGMVIDTSCIWWKQVCGKKYSCGYYDNITLRNRYMGLQVSYKMAGILLLMVLGWKAQRTQEYCLEKGHC
uniref:Solute carrier organic anion transporter family member n=1 Tax=Tetraodon nigroviridis TaxID=99883 RepID=H3DMV0_TETNG